MCKTYFNQIDHKSHFPSKYSILFKSKDLHYEEFVLTDYIQLSLGLKSISNLFAILFGPFVYFSQTHLNYLVFQYFDIELFQKCVLHTEFDIYVFIEILA